MQNDKQLKVSKRDGSVVPFAAEKICTAILQAGQASGEFERPEAQTCTASVVKVLEHTGTTERVVGLERIQDVVEQVLISANHVKTARAYIVYREQHKKLRADKRTLVDVSSSVNEYLDRADWRVNANANQGYSLGGLILNSSGKMIANYWLNHVYSPEIGQAHREGDIHIHDLDMLAGYCFTGDTKVALLDGTTPTLKELAETRAGESFWVYSRDENGKVVPGLAHSPRLTRKGTEIISVEISGGEKIRCTPDHQFMLRNGSYKEAQDLRRDDSLMPLYLSRAGNYLRIQDGKQGLCSYVHRHIASSVYQDDLTGKVVHHLNGDKHDNRPENLEIMDDAEHRAMEIDRTRQTTKWKTANAARLAEYNRSSAKRSAVSEFANGRGRDAGGMFYNHTVRRTPQAAGTEDVYCLTVDKYENFALASGVFVHNCAGWSLRTLLHEGLNGVPGKVEATPPKHLSSAVGQIVNFLGTLQNEWAGAQAFSSFDTYMAPYVRKDGLSYEQVLQHIQELIYNLNVPSRWGCVDDQTEVLTVGGFVKHDELTEGDMIYSWDEGALVTNPVKHVVRKRFAGKLHGYLGRNYEQVVSPEHRVLVLKHNGAGEAIKRSDEIFDAKTPYKLPVKFKQGAATGVQLDDSVVQLAAFIYTDGSLDYRNDVLHKVKFFKSSKRFGNSEFEGCCDTLGLGYTTRIEARGFSEELVTRTFYGDSARAIEAIVGKKSVIAPEFMRMDERSSALFLRTWAACDGCADKFKLQYDNDVIRDQLQEIAVRAGYTTYLKSRGKTNWIKLRKVSGVFPTERVEVDYDGLVWCPSVDSGTAIFRRNGSVFISGQCQTPFTNLTFDWVCPEDLREQIPVIANEEMPFAYGDLQVEMDMINRAYIEVMTKGDAQGRIFTFPIPTYNITPDFPWESENAERLFAMTAKYGLPYFQNFINSDMTPNQVRSMCPLHPDTEVVVRSKRQKRVSVRRIGDIEGSYDVLYDGDWVNAEVTTTDTVGCLDIDIRNGAKVTMDLRHEQPVKAGRGAATRVVQACDLVGGDYLPFNASALPNTMENYHAGYVVGAYLGDGSYDGGGLTFSLSTAKLQVVEMVRSVFEQMGFTVAESRIKELVSVRISQHNGASRAWMEQFVDGETALTKGLNQRCWQLGSEFLSGLLDGWYGTDGGNRGRIYTASSNLIDDFATLCGLLGRAYKLDREGDQREGRLGTNPVYTLKFHSRTAYAGEFFYEDGMWWYPIENIETSSHRGKVHCFAVNHEDHLFQLANGLVTHNCRLQLDLRELLKRGGGLFGSAEQTGSLGVVTVSCARLGYLYAHKETMLLEALDKLLVMARDSLEIKRKVIQRHMDAGLFPYTKRYLGTLRNHFSTIGVNGINEMVRNFTGDHHDITSKWGHAFACRLLDHIRQRMVEFQEETGHMYNLEATPAEGTTYRFAREDKKRWPAILQAGNADRPYYTNSSQLPVGFTDDPFEALERQDDLQRKYTGGTVLHLYMNERISSTEACRRLVRRSLERFRLPYITITPTFSVCPIHGYLSGEHKYCPKCDAELLARKQKEAADSTGEDE